MPTRAFFFRTRRNIARSLLAAGSTVAFADAARAQVSVQSVEYLTTYDAGERVTIFRGEPAPMKLRYGMILPTSATATNLRVTLPNGSTTTGFTTTQQVEGFTHAVTVTALTAPTAGHYDLRYSFGPVNFVVPLRLVNRATVSSIAPAAGTSNGSLTAPVGSPLVLRITGTNLDEAQFSRADFTRVGGNIIGDPQITGRSPTSLTLTFTPTLGVTFTINADDFLSATVPNCRPLCEATGPGRVQIQAGIDNRVTSMSALVVQPGTTVTLGGVNLRPPNYSIEVIGKSGTGAQVSAPVSGSATALQFSAPSNLRPDSVMLRYTEASSGEQVLRHLQPLPHPLYVRRPPALNDLDTASGVRLISTRITGNGLASTADVFPAGTAGVTRQSSTVSLANQAVPVTRWQRLPGSSNEILELAPTFTQPVFGDLVVSTSGGSTTVQNVAFMPPPVVQGLDMSTASGEVPVPPSSTLRPGVTYFLRGSNLFAVHNGTLRFKPVVRIGNVTLQSVLSTTGSTTRIAVLVPASISSLQTGTLTVTHAGGTSSGGTFTVAPRSQLPTVGGVSVTPSPVVGGVAMQATVAFNGPIPAGADTGTIDLVVPAALQAAIQPRIGIRVTGNPTTFTIPTLPVSTITTGTLTVRHSEGSAVSSQGTGAAVTLTPITLTGLTITQDTVTGGANVSQIRVTLSASAPVSNPVTVNFLSSNSGVLAVPSTSVGVTGTAFGFLQVATQRVAVNTPVIITAALNGTTVSDTVVVRPPRIQSVTTSSTSLTTFQTGTATITLEQPPVTPIPMEITVSDTTVITAPRTVTVSGQSQVVNLTARAVQQPRTVTLTFRGTNVTTTNLTVLPISMQLGVSPSSVAAGGNVTGTLNFGPVFAAPPGSGYAVRVTASDSANFVLTNGNLVSPQALQLVAGQTAIVFPLSTRGPVAAPRTITMTAHLLQLNVAGPPLATASTVLTIVP